MSDLGHLCAALIPVAREAGDAIMEVYNGSFEFDQKLDGSPVTEADRRAEAIILSRLAVVAPNTTIISEENPASHGLAAAGEFFLIDPLDGTKEFLKRDGKGAFTVNIALIRNKEPVLGIVYAPVLDRLFSGFAGGNASENGKAIAVRKTENGSSTAVASASHRDEKTNDWLKKNSIGKTVSIGSSLKFCLVAAGEADVYPRFGPTMEWDTAAGDAVLRSAGGGVTHPDGMPFQYGKADYRNGPFIASSEPGRWIG